MHNLEMNIKREQFVMQKKYPNCIITKKKHLEKAQLPQESECEGNKQDTEKNNKDIETVSVL